MIQCRRLVVDRGSGFSMKQLCWCRVCFLASISHFHRMMMPGMRMDPMMVWEWACLGMGMEYRQWVWVCLLEWAWAHRDYHWKRGRRWSRDYVVAVDIGNQ